MGPKGKKWTKSAPKVKTAKHPETENEFLEAADEFEQAANKWKAGDTAKALRFFQRAIDTYNEALKKWPPSFDLAYNKAVLQYQMTQDDRLAAGLGDRAALLNETLQSHRAALALNQDNADILFNTAQVLSSAAELLAEDEDPDSQQQAITLLKEAVEMFDSCLARQEFEFTEGQQQASQAAEDPQDVPEQPQQNVEMDEASDSAGSGEWATVMEPVTPSTLIETALAELAALSTLISLSSDLGGGDMSFQGYADVASPLVRQKLPGYIALLPETNPTTDQDEKPHGPFLSLATATLQSEKASAPSNPRLAAQGEADLAIALFACAVAQAEFMNRLLSAQAYHALVAGAFDALLPPNWGGTASPRPDSNPPSPALPAAAADALANLSATLLEAAGLASLTVPADLPTSTPESAGAINSTRWTALSRSSDLLSRLLKLPLPLLSAAQLKRSPLYLLLGDVELLRHRLASSPSLHDKLGKQAVVLLKNAGVYYRGAGKIAPSEGEGESVGEEADVKAWVVARLMGERTVKEMGDGDEGVVGEVVRAMVEEGMVGEEGVGLLGLG